jgi:hypothetical protein
MTVLLPAACLALAGDPGRTFHSCARPDPHISTGSDLQQQRGSGRPHQVLGA